MKVFYLNKNSSFFEIYVSKLPLVLTNKCVKYSEAENVRLRDANTTILKEKGEQKADYETRINQYIKDIAKAEKDKENLRKENK